MLGVTVLWITLGVIVITKMKVGVAFFFSMLGIIGGLAVWVGIGTATWFKYHPDPAWGHCVKSDLKQEPTRVGGQIESKPEWVCVLWG
jgi:hypothetical protein